RLRNRSRTGILFFDAFCMQIGADYPIHFSFFAPQIRPTFPQSCGIITVSTTFPAISAFHVKQNDTEKIGEYPRWTWIT
ncbi:MAG: hypothetical protein IKZ09_08605, partial [Clostridia bacterium]|nr:hypothetical protein [Clostridia bacterium]